MESNTWIDVKDKMPEPEIYVLCIGLKRCDHSNPDYLIMCYNDGKWWNTEYDEGYENSADMRGIWYWQPLPKPPQPKRFVWQYKTLQMDEWRDATDEEYEKGKDKVRFDWRRVEK